MSIFIHESPKSINWSKNPVMLRFFTTDDVATKSIKIEFTVEVEDLNEPLGWRDVFTGEKEFGTENLVHLDLSTYCDAELSFMVCYPWSGNYADNTLIRCEEQMKQFRIRYTRYEDNEADETFTRTDAFYVAKGGVPVQEYDREETFLKYFDEGPSTGYVVPLDFLGETIQVCREQVFFFSFVVTRGLEEFNKVNVTYTYNDNTTDTVTMDAPAPEGKVGVYAIHGLRPPVSVDWDDVKAVTFAVIGDVNTVLYSRTYHRSKKWQSRTRQYVYVNSIGGTEVALLPFNESVQLEYDRSTSSIYTDNGLHAQQYKIESPAQRLAHSTFETRGRVVDTGRLSYEQTSNLRQMMVSGNVFEASKFYNSAEGQMRYVPQIITSKKALLVDNKNSSVFGFAFEFQDAFDNSNLSKMETGLCAVATNFENINKPLLGTCFLYFIAGISSNAALTVDANKSKFVAYDTAYSGDTSATVLQHPVLNSLPQLWKLGYLYGEALTSFVFFGVRISKITGKLPNTLRRLETRSAGMTELPKLPQALSYLYCDENTITKIPVLPTNLYYLVANDNDINDLTAANEAELFPTGLVLVQLQNNAIPVAQIEAFMQRVVDNNVLWDVGDDAEMDFSGQTPPAPLSGAGLTLKTALEALNWTVTVDV